MYKILIFLETERINNKGLIIDNTYNNCGLFDSVYGQTKAQVIEKFKHKYKTDSLELVDGVYRIDIINRFELLLETYTYQLIKETIKSIDFNEGDLK